MQFCRIVLTKKKIAECHLTESSRGRIVESAKLYNAERHFSESLFSRTSFFRIVVQPNVISSNHRFAEMQFCRIVVLPEKNCRKSFDRIVQLAKLHNAERHFSESLFSRTSFPRIIVQPNVIFTNRRSDERHFPETSSARTSFRRNYMSSSLDMFNMDTVRIRKSRNGRFDLIVMFVPFNAFSGKWCSAKWCVRKMTFG